MRRFIDSPEKFGAAVVALLAFAGLAAFAAGNGGGGTPVPPPAPACAQDIWDCGNWSACTDGHQDRTCTLTFDCAGTDTPKPAVRQSCATPAACTGANWRCSDWHACNADGLQLRDCRHTNECPDQQSEKPEGARLCPTLQCDQATLAERVACRLNLSEAGMARENQIRYLPELCRTMTDAAEQAACIAKYKSFDPCWSAAVPAERLACARTVLGVSSDVKTQAGDCDALPFKDRKACHASLLAKVSDLVLFRMYDLEERAEDARETGASNADVAILAVGIEESKVEFVKATSSQARKAAILNARTAWQAFLKATDSQGSH